MLAVLDILRADAADFVLLAPEQGALADAIRARDLEFLPLQAHDASGKRLDRKSRAEQLVSAVQRCRPDLLHANSLAMGRLTGSIAAQLSVPCTAHLRDILRLSRAAINDLNANQQLIAVSQAVRAFHSAQGLDAERTVVIHNGIDTGQFSPRDPSGFLKRELSLSDDCRLIGAIGQIGLRKGQDVLAAAARRIATTSPHAHYVLVGERNSQKQENIDFENRLIEQFPPGRLHRLGTRSDVADLLPEFELLVHPARQEPFGRVLLEAAAAARPIVATNVGGTAEMLTDEAEALLVPPDDSQALGVAMTRLMNDPELGNRLANAARHRVLQEFTAEKSAAELLRFWKRALD